MPEIDYYELYFDNDEVLREAEPEQFEFIARYRREQWRENERRRIFLIVEKAFDGEKGAVIDGWKRWCYQYICWRLHDNTRWEWVPTLALMDEDLLFSSKRQNSRAEGYLKRIQETARSFVKEHRLECKKGCDY